MFICASIYAVRSACNTDCSPIKKGIATSCPLQARQGLSCNTQAMPIRRKANEHQTLSVNRFQNFAGLKWNANNSALSIQLSEADQFSLYTILTSYALIPKRNPAKHGFHPFYEDMLRSPSTPQIPKYSQIAAWQIESLLDTPSPCSGPWGALRYTMGRRYR